jgi:enoyl-CoA hydratase/carnithine racemase
MTGSKVVRVEREGPIGRIILQRPEALNALNREMIESLSQAFDDLARLDEVRVAVVESACERAFSTGADLKERKELSLEELERHRVKLVEMFRKATEFPKPLIAAVHGFALGGGFELALACDLILADETAIFGLPEVSLGIIPGGGGTQALPRRIGVSRAKELIFTARRVEAREAERLGIVIEVVPRGEAPARARALAEKMAENAPISLRQAKRAIDGGLGRTLEEGWAVEDVAYRVTLATEDRLEGLQAFAERRKPQYRGR